MISSFQCSGHRGHSQPHSSLCLPCYPSLLLLIRVLFPNSPLLLSCRRICLAPHTRRHTPISAAPDGLRPHPSSLLCEKALFTPGEVTKQAHQPSTEKLVHPPPQRQSHPHVAAPTNSLTVVSAKVLSGFAPISYPLWSLSLGGGEGAAQPVIDTYFVPL